MSFVKCLSAVFRQVKKYYWNQVSHAKTFSLNPFVIIFSYPARLNTRQHRGYSRIQQVCLLFDENHEIHFCLLSTILCVWREKVVLSSALFRLNCLSVHLFARLFSCLQSRLDSALFPTSGFGDFSGSSLSDIGVHSTHNACGSQKSCSPWPTKTKSHPHTSPVHTRAYTNFSSFFAKRQKHFRYCDLSLSFFDGLVGIRKRIADPIKDEIAPNFICLIWKAFLSISRPLNTVVDMTVKWTFNPIVADGEYLLFRNKTHAHRLQWDFQWIRVHSFVSQFYPPLYWFLAWNQF